MSTTYFILTKPKSSPINSNTDSDIINTNNKNVYILPRNNISYYVDKGLFESNLIEWCKQFCSKDKRIIDVGAHSGTYSISLSSYCKEVEAFEPQKMTYYSLCGSVCLSGITNITCHNYGLGSKEQVGELILNIISNDGGGSTIIDVDDRNVLRKETIKIKMLDEYEFDDVGFIKVDIEGNEKAFFEGAKQTLIRCKYPKILFESNSGDKDPIDVLTNMGYKVLNVNGVKNMLLATI